LAEVKIAPIHLPAFYAAAIDGRQEGYNGYPD
jgi:hypothetical protein